MRITLILLFTAAMTFASEPIVTNTQSGKVEKSSSGTGGVSKPYDFSAVSVTGLSTSGLTAGTGIDITSGVISVDSGVILERVSDTTPTADDLLLTYDETGAALKKVTMQNFANNLIITQLLDSVSGFGANFVTSHLTANHQINVPNSDSTMVVPLAPTAGVFVTGVSTLGVLTTASGGGGGGSPGGSNGQVQYNNATAFGGITSLTTNGSTVTQSAGNNFRLADSSDATKLAGYNLTNITTATTRTIVIPDADSVTVVPTSATSNQFITNIPSGGTQTKAQPAFSNLSGTATNGQLPTTISSKTFDDTNTYTAKQNVFTLENNSDVTKTANFTLANLTTGTNRVINVADANSTTVIADTGASNNFLTAISAQGVISKAQPTGAGLSMSDVTTNNVSTSQHGFAPKSDGVSTHYLDGTGAYSTPAGGGGGTPGGSNTQVQYNNSGAFGGITGATTNGTALTLVAPVLGTPASGTLTNCTFPTLNQNTTGSAAILTTARTLWGQSFDGSANVTGSLTAVGNITGGASSMTVTAGTGNSRTLALQSTTSGGTATTFLTGNADQSSTFGGNISGTGAWTLTGGAGNMTIVSGTGNSRTMSLQTTTSGGTATTFLTGNADQSATFAGPVSIGTGNAFTAGTIELGAASDTTIARVSAGKISVEGVNVVTTSSTDTLTNKTLTSPTLTTPVLGTPSSGTLTSCTGLPISTGVSGLGTGVATALAVNTGSAGAFGVLIASGTSALGTSAISSGACATTVTTSATGTATTDVISWTPNADISAVTGYAPVTGGGLIIYPFPTTNNVNWKVCNPTSSSITPGAVTLNWRVVR